MYRSMQYLIQYETWLEEMVLVLALPLFDVDSLG